MDKKMDNEFASKVNDDEWNIIPFIIDFHETRAVPGLWKIAQRETERERHR